VSNTISLREANQRFARCIREVEAGAEYVITRNGRPVARLVPVGGRRNLTAAQEAALARPGPAWQRAGQSEPVRSTARRCMSADDERFTLDTNLLVYAIGSAAGARHDAAGQIIQQAVQLDCWLTLQAVSEFYAVVTRKGIVQPPDAAAQAADWLDLFPCAAASEAAVRTALADAAVGRASYWDALLVATAGEAGCQVVLTEDLAEDLADGADLGGIRIRNPFSPSGGLPEQARGLLGLPAS
jgi:prevent-host-death family protein